MSLAAVAAISLFQAMLAAAAAAEPVISQSLSSYVVSGDTPQEVRTDLNRRGPLDASGHRFDAITRWNVNWHYTYRSNAATCAIASVSLKVSVLITYPLLKSDAPPELRRAFDTYTDNLLSHERGHADIGINIARRIEAAIAALPAETTCTRLGETANALGHSLVKEANAQDIDYDARTRHGATQGARFP